MLSLPHRRVAAAALWLFLWGLVPKLMAVQQFCKQDQLVVALGAP
jgi:hypothetical protein